MNTLEKEQLEEAKLALQTSKANEQRLMNENRAILDALSSMSGTHSKQQTFNVLLPVLKQYINFEDAVILSRSEAEESFNTLLSTNQALASDSWVYDEKFERGLEGDCIVLYKPNVLTQFDKFNSIVKDQIGSVLLTGVKTEANQYIILFLGKHRSQFGSESKAALMRFLPLIERALVDITYKEKLQSIVMSRTAQLRRSRERFHDFANSVGDWLWETDKRLNFTYISELNSLSFDLSNKDLLSQINNVNLADQIRDSFDKRQPFKKLEWCNNESKGEWLSVSGAPYYDQHGNFLGYRGIVKDVTLRRRRFLEVKKARLEAEKANRAKSEFLAMMSHEIRTPLNAILGLIDVLLGSTPREKDQDRLELMASSAELLLAIISDVLDLSKVESASFKLEKQVVNLRDTVTNSLTQYHPIAESKGLSFITSLDEELPIYINTDPTRLSQILFNLVGNAIKFTSVGCIKISISLSENKYLNLEVEDTGIGMEQNAIDKLFSPFVQADSSITRKFGGTGLGLTITKHLVHSFNGSICVTSDIGQGSRFLVSIPVTTSHVRNDDFNNTTTSGNNEEVIIKRQSLNILVAEDSPANQMVIQLLLNNLGHNVTIANNGLEAIEIAKENENNLDLIFMDISMPEMDGITATRELRKLNISLPILALTAHAMPDDKAQCLSSGMDDFITKPVRSKDLQRALSRFL
ncbi:response regulator [Vibrio tapetis subsp. quintayensis]|uniref:response regulator n=1 Tax=Vibrio tapetis TaxID=52443 RepID=UPI0025B32B7F|nr:response regulator [Vibrio tapetis]MDN3679186.1 response regulator [Vibrio tapetis subsp. quintayensis]